MVVLWSELRTQYGEANNVSTENAINQHVARGLRCWTGVITPMSLRRVKLVRYRRLSEGHQPWQLQRFRLELARQALGLAKNDQQRIAAIASLGALR